MIWTKIIFLGTLVSSTAQATTTLNDYLGQVRNQNQSYQSSTERSQGAALLSREADIFFTPQFIANATVGSDEKLSSTPQLVYDRLKTEVYNVGIEQNFNFGLETKLTYELTNTNLEGAYLGPNVPTQFWDAGPKIELTMPLWKNGFGRTARANRDASRNQNLADQYNSQAQAENILVNAESAYWRLSAAQEQLKIQKQALTAGQNILNYVTNKSNKNLGDRADVLQADALVEAYNLQLLQAQNELAAAQRSYNTFLNLESNATVPELEPLSYTSLENISPPAKRPGDRPDIKAAEAQTKAAAAASQLATERNRPQLDVFGSYKLNGRGDDQPEAIKDADVAQRDTTYVGLRLKVPLYVTAVDDAITGAKMQKSAAERNERNLRYDQEQQWNDIVQKLSESKQALKLATKMEAAQKAKLENERTRLRQGRTTTYQILLFEQDYSQAQASRVRSATQILNLQSQIKLYSAVSAQPEGEK